MPIPNLKQILQSDTQQERLDKINYNFDQLVANGGGPMGSPGPIGEIGATGVTGDQGPQGTQGIEGAQGPIADSISNYWKDGQTYSTSGVRVQTYVPVHTPLSGNAPSAPPTVLLGFSTEYEEYGDIGSGNLQYYNSQLVVNKNTNYVESNIRLVSDKNTDVFADLNLDIDLDANVPTADFTIGFKEGLTGTNNIKYKADLFEFKDLLGNDLLTMDSTNGSVFTGNFVSTGTAHFVGSIFKIDIASGLTSTPNDPAAGKVAVSLDTEGTIGFKTPEEIGAGIPIGTIISFLTSIYEDPNNFQQSQDISGDINGLVPTEPDEIEIEIGRGLIGTDYEGWYLCNGETWQTSDGTSPHVSYITPNLNSFTYTISNGVDDITSGPQQTISNLLGGSSVDMSQNSGIITLDYQNAPETTYLNTDYNAPSTNPFQIVRAPQLIYLGRGDLIFKAAGIPPTELTFNSFNQGNVYDDLKSGISIYDLTSPSDSSKGATKQIQLSTSLAGSFASTNIADLEYDKPEIIEIEVEANEYLGQPPSPPPLNGSYNSGKYGWFVNWNEQMFPDSTEVNKFSTREFVDKGEYDYNTTYYEGDVVYVLDSNVVGYWYTLLKGQPSGFLGASAPGITSAYTPADGWTTCSWAKPYGDTYWYRLPGESNYTQTGIVFNQYGDGNFPTYNGYPSSGDNLYPGSDDGWEGAFHQGITFSNENVFNTPGATVADPIRVYPPQMTISASDDLNSIKGAYTQPFQVFGDPITNDGTTNDSIILPVITTANLAEIQNRYPDLGITSADTVQYSDPYGYTDTADYWTEDEWGWPIPESPLDFEHPLRGGHVIVNNESTAISDNVHSWRPGQNDTDFRRYQKVRLKVLLEPNIVNQYIATQDNPALVGSTINLGLGHAASSPNPNLPPNTQGGPQWNYPAVLNSQPLGRINAVSATVSNSPVFNTITIGSGNAYLDDSGSTPPTDTVTFTVTPTSTVMTESDVQLNLPPLYSNAVIIAPYSFTNNGSGSYSFDITTGPYSCPGSSMGLTWSLTITHPNDSAAYDDTNINFDTCDGGFVTGGPRTGNNNNNNTAVEWEYYFSSGYGGQARQISYYDATGVQQYEMVYSWNTISNPVQVCQENGIQYGQLGSSLISIHPTLNHNITTNICV